MDEETQIVNIKGVLSKEWERARGIAGRNGESMGQYVSRALAQLADREAGANLVPPERFDPPASLPALPARDLPDFREVMAVVVAMSQAGIPIQKRVSRKLNRLVYEALDR